MLLVLFLWITAVFGRYEGWGRGAEKGRIGLNRFLLIDDGFGGFMILLMALLWCEFVARVLLGSFI